MPSNNIPLNGWPQLKNLEKVTPILSELDKIETWQKSVKQETKTGAYVEYTNALALNAVAVSADITATQDLHGYDKPWVGGAGKNKLPNNIVDGTVNDITYTKQSDDSFKINGTATGNANRLIANISLANGSYILSKGQSNGSFGLVAEAYNGTTWVKVLAQSFTTDDAAFTVDNDGYDTVRISVRTESGKTADNLIYYPMIRLSTESDASFAPYANICPITGFSSVTITDVDAESQTATVTVALGQTVYGGTLDLTSGELTVTYAIDTLTSADQLSGSAPQTSANGNWMGMNLTASPVHEVANISLICSNCKAISFNDRLTADSTDRAYINDVNDIAVLRLKKDTAITTKSDFFAHFENAQIVYELGTPTTATLTAAQVALVAGYNKIESDTGNIEVTAYTGDTWN